MMTRIATSSRNWTTSGIDIIARPGSQNPAPRLLKAIEIADDMIERQREAGVDREHHAVGAAPDQRADGEVPHRGRERPFDGAREPAVAGGAREQRCRSARRRAFERPLRQMRS